MKLFHQLWYLTHTYVIIIEFSVPKHSNILTSCIRNHAINPFNKQVCNIRSHWTIVCHNLENNTFIYMYIIKLITINVPTTYCTMWRRWEHRLRYSWSDVVCPSHEPPLWWQEKSGYQSVKTNTWPSRVYSVHGWHVSVSFDAASMWMRLFILAALLVMRKRWWYKYTHIYVYIYI